MISIKKLNSQSVYKRKLVKQSVSLQKKVSKSDLEIHGSSQSVSSTLHCVMSWGVALVHHSTDLEDHSTFCNTECTITCPTILKYQ